MTLQRLVTMLSQYTTCGCRVLDIILPCLVLNYTIDESQKILKKFVFVADRITAKKKTRMNEEKMPLIILV